jgi:hypothetical protein
MQGTKMIRFPFLCMLFIIFMHFENQSASYRHDFIHAADTQKSSADSMMHEIMQPHKPDPIEHSSGQKKKLIPRFLSMGRKKKCSSSFISTKKSLISSEPSSSQNPIQNSEKISEIYIGALSFYNACYKGASPATAMYIRMQSTDILHQLTSLHAPVHLFAPTTLFEAGYKEVLLQSKELTEEPIMHTLIINDIMKEHLSIKKAIASGPNLAQCAVLCSTLHSCMKTLMYMYTANRIEEYQKINIHAYAKQTWQLLHTVPDCSFKAHTIQKLHAEWNLICKEKLNIFSLLDELERHAQKNILLYSNPLVTNNKIFCKELIKDQCNTLHNLLYVHQANAHNPLQQYWIAKAADTSIKLVTQTGISQKPHPAFIAVYRNWQRQHLDVVTLLRHIRKTQEIFSKYTPEQIAHTCFEMLAVLNDIYYQFIIPPHLLTRLINPLHIAINALNTSDIKHRVPSTKDLRNIKTAANIIHTAPEAYLINYIMQKAEKTAQVDKESAKRIYFSAVKHIIDTPNTSSLYNSILPDRIYYNLLDLYEKNISFSPAELTQLKLFADHIKMPLPLSINIKKESVDFRSFLHTLDLQKLIEQPPCQKASSSCI